MSDEEDRSWDGPGIGVVNSLKTKVEVRGLLYNERDTSEELIGRGWWVIPNRGGGRNLNRMSP